MGFPRWTLSWNCARGDGVFEPAFISRNRNGTGKYCERADAQAAPITDRRNNWRPGCDSNVYRGIKTAPVESYKCILLGTNYRHTMTRLPQNQNHSPSPPNKDSRRKSTRKRLPPDLVKKPTHHGNVYMARRFTGKKGCPSPINMGNRKGARGLNAPFTGINPCDARFCVNFEPQFPTP